MLLANALYRAPLGQRELFAVASARFGWASQKAFSRQNDPQTSWVSQLIDQSLSMAALPAAAAAGYADAVAAASATERPMHAQAYTHYTALSTLARDFPAWSSLWLPSGRIDAWRAAYDGLPADYVWRRRARGTIIAGAKWVGRSLFAVLKFVIGLFDNWISRLMIGIVGLSLIVTAFTGQDPRSAAQRVSDNVMLLAYANAQRSAALPSQAVGTEAGQVPVPLYELPGRINTKYCTATHQVLHEREARVFDDPALIASLGTHAMLCVAQNRWPALSDPIVRCLQDETWAANSQNRPQNNAHCAKAVASK
ncbi:hypothetical protein FXN63_09490 [Pigmentiphaga aceris]|uniref:Uncharacterized protein n=1 Tax=Pigmentiphaga aceris TaxID=1940612 RepID=A0A5C0AWL6_9BURK|nr:hypothetical protein [Pigmentiphaga aceris]QEI06044.1 hypothetical protein FXN63_09490 [Pigmentiphaga aceris]